MLLTAEHSISVEDDEFVAVGIADDEFTVAPRPILRLTGWLIAGYPFAALAAWFLPTAT